MKRGAQRERIEREWGKPLADVLTEYRDRGYSLRDVSAELGVTRSALSRWSRALGIPFPRMSSRTIAKISAARSQKTARYGRRVLTLREISQETGLALPLLRNRYDRGLRGKDLVRPVYGLGRQREYELGLSVAEWEIVTEYARAHSVHTASDKFLVPKGAIKAVMADDWRRVG